jgi:hypothetical protein
MKVCSDFPNSGWVKSYDQISNFFKYPLRGQIYVGSQPQISKRRVALFSQSKTLLYYH